MTKVLPIILNRRHVRQILIDDKVVLIRLDGLSEPARSGHVVLNVKEPHYLARPPHVLFDDCNNTDQAGLPYFLAFDADLTTEAQTIVNHAGLRRRSGFDLPASLSRLWLHVVSYETKRLHDITPLEALANGDPSLGFFRERWNMDHGDVMANAWEGNPLVHFISFKRGDRPDGF